MLIKFRWLKIYFNPFKVKPKLKFHIGKISVGVPIFYPRVWRKSKTKQGYLEPFPKIIGFDFTDLYWKTKWSEYDIRFEHSPVWSFVFFKWQIAIEFIAPWYLWEAFLMYEYKTDRSLSTKERLDFCKENFPLKYTRYSKDNEGIKICYYDEIL